MLKSSPIIASSANASPSFRYAPANLSPYGSPRQQTAMRPGSSSRSAASSAATSMKSPVQSRSKRPAGAGDSEPDATNLRSGLPEDPGNSLEASSLNHTPAEPPQAPIPKPLVISNSVSSQDNASQAAYIPTPVPSEDAVPQNLSPTKRRGSPTGESQTSRPPQAPSEATAGQDGTSLSAKRSRHDESPAKILPQKYELCPVGDMVELIAHMVADLITTNDAIRVASGGLTRFHSRTAPGISVRDYLHRLARHATLTPPLLLAMVYYIDRLCALYPEFTINTLTVHRFLITAATVAAKGLSDAFWNNTTYARVGGIRLAELKMLELEFLYRVDWRIVPNPEVLVAYYQGLVERTPGYELEAEIASDDDELDDDEIDSED